MKQSEGARLWLLVCTGLVLQRLVVAAKTQDDDVTLSIEEESRNHTLVGELSQRPQVQRRLQGIPASTCKYSWVQKKHLLANKLSLDEQTGRIFTIGTIDREEYLTCGVGSVCCSSASIICSIPISVGVQCTGHQMIIISVRLELNDKNDHAPQFPTQNFSLEIPESAEVGSRYYFPAAVDPDSNPYSIDSYELLARGETTLLPRDLFDTKVVSGRVQLTLKRRLDREVQERYDFDVRATDRQRREGTMSLTVLVSDVNDHAPVFSAPSKLYNVTVPEDMRVGDTIVQLHATDNDAGDNAQVMYEFHETATPYVREKFALDEESGHLTLRAELDYEATSRIEFLVVAKNRIPFHNRLDEASVIINVQNVNDEAPVIEVEYRNELPDDRTSGETSENLPNTFVAFIFVSDRDSGSINCSLSNDRFKLESFYRQPTSTDFRLNATRPFDRETNALETVTITCSDRGQPPRSSSQLVRIHVKDANDQLPTFKQAPIRCSVLENNHVGTPICLVSDFVTDLDEGENSLVKYTIEKSARSYFRIEEFSGQLSATTSFDRENRSSFQFLVFATDQGKPPLSATGTVVVTVTDANDNAPRFTYPLNSPFRVREQVNPNEYVGTVRAVDPDAESNAKIVYSLDASRAAPFRITESGEIFSTTELDRESEESFHLTVFATDGGNPPLSSSATIVVHVDNVNDCHPTIAFPSVNNFTVRISYLEQPSRPITTVVATDRDAADTPLRFSFSEGNDRGLFLIDRSSGMIQSAKALTDALGEHLLMVRVEDGGSPNLHAEARLRIIVDNSPPTYDYANPQPTNSIGAYAVSTMHLVIIVALASAIVLVLLVAIGIIIRRRLMMHNSIFSPPSHQKRKTRKKTRRFADVLAGWLHPGRREPPAKSIPSLNASICERSKASRGQAHAAHQSRDKLGSLQKLRDRKDVTNQEDLEVQAAFLQLTEEGHGAHMEVNGDDGQIYATVDTESGAYDEGLYNGHGQLETDDCKNELPLHTVSEHVCPHGQPGTLVPYGAAGAASMTLVPVTPTVIDPTSYFRSLVPNSSIDRPYFQSDAHVAHVHTHMPSGATQNVYAQAMYGDVHGRSRSQPRFGTMGVAPSSTTPTIPLHRLYQDTAGHVRMYPSRPHTAMHALQSDSFSSVAVTVATPEPRGGATQPAGWAPGSGQPESGYFQYDECNNVAPVQHKSERRRKRTQHGDEQYYTIDRVKSPVSDVDAPQNNRVYGGIVKGSFV